MKFHPCAIYSSALITAFAILDAPAQEDDYVELQFVSYPPVAYDARTIQPPPAVPASSAPNGGPVQEEISEDPQVILVKKDFVELMISPEESLKIDLPTAMLSKVYRVKRLSNWVLGKSGMGPDGKRTFSVYGKTPSASYSKQILLVVPKGKTYADGLNIASLDGSSNGFKPGQYLLVNLSTTEVAGTIGNIKYMLKSGGNKLMTPEANETKFGLSVLHVYSYYRNNDKVKTIQTTEWVLDDKARIFLFFYNDPRNQKVRMYHFRDYP